MREGKLKYTTGRGGEKEQVYKRERRSKYTRGTQRRSRQEGEKAQVDKRERKHKYTRGGEGEKEQVYKRGRGRERTSIQEGGKSKFTRGRERTGIQEGEKEPEDMRKRGT